MNIAGHEIRVRDNKSIPVVLKYKGPKAELTQDSLQAIRLAFIKFVQRMSRSHPTSLKTAKKLHYQIRRRAIAHLRRLLPIHQEVIAHLEVEPLS